MIIYIHRCILRLSLSLDEDSDWLRVNALDHQQPQPSTTDPIPSVTILCSGYCCGVLLGGFVGTSLIAAHRIHHHTKHYHIIFRVNRRRGLGASDSAWGKDSPAPSVIGQCRWSCPLYFFWDGGTNGWPRSLPRSFMPSTRSILPRITLFGIPRPAS